MTRQSSSDPTIVSLSDFRDRAQRSVISQIEAYWEGLRNGRIMPARSEVDPRGIAGSLENAFILERVARGVGRFRLAGMHLNDVMGMEVRGMPMTALILPESRDEMNAVLAAVFDEPAVARLSLTSDTGLGRSEMEGKMILLPLRSDLGDVSRVLGCFVAEGKIGRAPRRFKITAQTCRTLIGYADKQPRPASAETAPPAEPPTASRPGRPSGRSHLQLVKTDE